MEKTILCWDLTPSLPQPVKFPGWMMHRSACKQYIFLSYDIYFSMLCVLMEILSRASAKKKKKRKKKEKNKRFKGFKFLHFYDSFSNDIMAVKGLRGWPTLGKRPPQTVFMFSLLSCCFTLRRLPGSLNALSTRRKLRRLQGTRLVVFDEAEQSPECLQVSTVTFFVSGCILTPTILHDAKCVRRYYTSR